MSTATPPDPPKPNTDVPSSPASPPPSPPAAPAPALTPTGDTAPADLKDMLGEERELWTGRMSWKHFAGQGVLWLIGAIVLLWLYYAHLRAAENPSVWGSRIVWLLILGSAVAIAVRATLIIYGTRYRLTTQRLFLETGILSRTIDQTELIRVDDVRMYQSVADRIFGLGDVEMICTTDATQPNVRIRGIASPAQVAEHVRLHTRTLRSRKSLFVEQL